MNTTQTAKSAQFNRLTQSYFAIVTVVGIALILASLPQTLRLENSSWMYLGLLTVLSSLFGFRFSFMKGQSSSLTLTVSDCFIFAGFLLFNPGVAVVLAAIEAIGNNVRFKVRGMVKQLFNIGQVALTTYVVAHLFYFLKSILIDSGQLRSGGFLLVLLPCALIYFFLNTTFIALAMSMASSKRFLEMWKGHFFWVALSNLVNAVAALVIFFSFNPLSLSFVVAILCLGLSLYYAHEVHAIYQGSEGEEEVAGSALLRLGQLRFFEGALPWRARTYIAVVSLAAVPIVLYSLYSALNHFSLNWVYLIVLTVVASCLPIRVAWFKGESKMWLSLSDVFVFTAILKFGPEVAVIVAAIEGITFNLRNPSGQRYRRLFNLAQISVAAFAIGHVFYLVRYLPEQNTELLMAFALICGAAYFIVTSGLISAAMALVAERSFMQIWRHSLPWAMVTLTAAVLGTAVYLRFELTAVSWLLAFGW